MPIVNKIRSLKHGCVKRESVRHNLTCFGGDGRLTCLKEHSRPASRESMCHKSCHAYRENFGGREFLKFQVLREEYRKLYGAAGKLASVGLRNKKCSEDSICA